MKVSYTKEPSRQEDAVEIYYREENEQIEVIRNFFSSLQSITGRKGDEVCVLHPGCIFYLEVVDRKLFAYLKEEVYQLDYSMKQFADYFGTEGFVQISKNMIVNLYRVRKVKADLNMRLRLVMDNDEILILNRTYKKVFLDALYHIQEVCHEDHQ